MSSQKGARSKLADVLADIKSSRIEDEYDYSNHDIAPTPAKRRSAVNYVALSGHTPRSSRSSTANANSSQSQQGHEAKIHTNNNISNNKSSTQQQSMNATTNSSTTRTRTYILKLFDRTVDLAQFTEDKSCVDPPLYPICRAWVHGHRSGQTSPHNKSEPMLSTPQVSSTTKQQSTEKNNNDSSPGATQQQDSPTLAEAASTEVHTMPPPKLKLEVMKQLKLNTENVTESTDIRIPPSVRDYKPQEDVAEMIDKSIKSMDHQECMNLNRQRWKKVRREWAEARRIHEARYEESFKILHAMSSQQRGI